MSRDPHLRLVHAERRARAYPAPESMSDLIDRVLAKPIRNGKDPLFDPNDHEVARLKELVRALFEMAARAEAEEADARVVHDDGEDEANADPDLLDLFADDAPGIDALDAVSDAARDAETRAALVQTLRQLSVGLRALGAKTR